MKTAVIDIGTRASRLIVGDTTDIIENRFSFDFFQNEGQLTEAGKGIVPQGDGYELQLQHLRDWCEWLAVRTR